MKKGVLSEMKKSTAIIGAFMSCAVAMAAAPVWAAAGKSGGTLTIGYVGGLSGPTAAFGLPISQAVEYAVDQINHNGGIDGMQVKLVKIDDSGNPFNGQQAIDRFASQGIKFVISGSSSAVALSEVPKVSQDKMVAVSPVATDPAVARKNPSFFVIIPNNNMLGASVATYGAKNLKIKQVVSFVRDDAYGTSIEKAFKQRAQKLGMKVVKEFTYPTDSQDFNSYLSQALKSYPKATIFLSGYASDSGLIAKQARALGYSGVLLGTEPLTSDQYLQIASSGANDTVVSDAYFEGANKSKAARAFVNAWKAKYHVSPDVYQVHGYDAVYVLKKAIEDAHSTDPQVVRKKLLSLKNFKGASGTISFNANGSVNKPVYIVEWKDNKLHFLKTFQPGDIQ
ncbi:MAG: ABC transporter substrate-binding protein [Alicyclobacillus sp.]|nr:ABC transporter substrate-binding protein [Alicyclobacillus sp.]